MRTSVIVGVADGVWAAVVVAEAVEVEAGLGEEAIDGSVEEDQGPEFVLLVELEIGIVPESGRGSVLFLSTPKGDPEMVGLGGVLWRFRRVESSTSNRWSRIKFPSSSSAAPSPALPEDIVLLVHVTSLPNSISNMTPLKLGQCALQRASTSRSSIASCLWNADSSLDRSMV